LRADQVRVRELERDNAQLVEQAKIASLFPQYQQQPARVIGRDDPRTREKMLVIDRGAEDGIEVGMPVLSPSFLIGLVTEVYPRSAKVRLIIDEKSAIGVQLQEERAQGILYGLWQRGGRLTMKHIERSVLLAPDPANPPRVVTALGMTARVPPGLLVGYVTSVKKNDQADQQQAEVVPYVSNFDGLELVTVLLTGDR
jgi:rod shape-determining protein MreC